MDLGELLRSDPETMKRLLGLSGLDDQAASLQDQLAQARMQQAQHGGPHSGVWAAALHGLNGAANQMLGAYGEKQLQGKLGGIRDQRDAGRMSFADLLRGHPSQPVEGLSSPSATLPFENGPQFGPPASAFTPNATTPGLGLDLNHLPMDPKAKALLDALRGASGGMPAMGAMPNDVLGGR